MMDKNVLKNTAWKDFEPGVWMDEVNVRSFIQKNYTLYEGDDSFLAGVSEKTAKVWEKCHELIVEEIKKGIIDVETDIISGIDNFAPGYIDKAKITVPAITAAAAATPPAIARFRFTGSSQSPAGASASMPSMSVYMDSSNSGKGSVTNSVSSFSTSVTAPFSSS